MMDEHKHFIISCNIESPPTEVEFVESWLSDLVKKIDMEILIPPQAVYCDMVGNKGITAFTIITTSHIVLHTFEDVNGNYLELDVYSCKSFNPESVIKEIDVFKPNNIKYKFLDRRHDLDDYHIK